MIGAQTNTQLFREYSNIQIFDYNFEYLFSKEKYNIYNVDM